MSTVYKAVKFLKELFVPELHLLKETKTSNRVFITVDNYLAMNVLSRVDSEFARELSIGLKRWCSVCLPTSRTLALSLHYVPYMPYKTVHEKLATIRNVTVMCERELAEIVYDYYNYADCVALMSLTCLLGGRVETAVKYYMKLCSMWEGKGFVDKVYKETGLYETYKVALFVILCRLLNLYPTFFADALHVLYRMQREDGGFVTHYDDELRYRGDANVETTCLAILALTVPVSIAFT